VVLEREEDAAAAGRRIYAVIRGWGISSDGHGGLSRPRPAASGWRSPAPTARPGISPAEVGYFEGHGTGTAVGDAAELAALKAARREAGATVRAALGSVKANIGHTKAAAGAAALIKATMAVHSQILPPHTGSDRPPSRDRVRGVAARNPRPQAPTGRPTGRSMPPPRRWASAASTPIW